MARTIDYFFTLASPWAYIGHRAFTELAKRHRSVVRFKPAAVGTIYPESGGLPLAKRHPLRQRYRDVELQRWREKRGLQFHSKPTHWPFEPTFADCIAVALAAEGADVEGYVAHAFEAVFEEQRDLQDPTVVTQLLTAVGADPNAFMKAAVSAETKAAYEANTRAALDAGVFGFPSYVLDGEVFWGQDRLELLDDALASGRAPFRPTESKPA